MLAIGLPDFGPVQNNVSFNADRGVTRGIHTEPWDKFVSLATGRIFGAWVDMREGESFGATFSLEMDTSVAVFVPRGVGNSYQTLEDATAYTYLVNEHWRPGITYPALALDDPTVAIPWPIPLADAIISDKDQHNPALDPATAIAPKRTLVLGAGGQLGKALVAALPGAEGVTRAELDVTDAEAVAAWPWHEYAVVLNAAAYTAVDAAETPEGRRDAWAANATAPATLARLSSRHGFTLVHYSSEYVFDGTAEEHTEDEPLSPLGVYAQSKAAGDIAVATAPRHYLLRTSWVIGEGNNFVRTMQRLAGNGVSPSVVSDQVGRLTFTDELVRATRHLLDVRRRPRHLPRVQRRPGDVVGRGRAGGLRALRPVGRRRRRDHDRGVRRRRARPGQALRPAPAAQRDVAGTTRVHRLRARGRDGCAGPLPRGRPPSGRSRPRGGRCRPRRCRRRAAPR